MAFSKVILNGTTLMDVTSNTNAAGNMLSGTVGTKNDGTSVTGNIANMTLPSDTSSTQSGTQQAIIPISQYNRYLNIPVGYNPTAKFYRINQVVLDSLYVDANGTYTAGDIDADGITTVTVAVPNTYQASDEGKVVNNGALVSQTSRTVTTNGIYDTTLNNSVSVEVSGSEFVVTLAWNDQTDMYEPDYTWSDICTAYYGGETVSTYSSVGLSEIFIDGNPSEPEYTEIYFSLLYWDDNDDTYYFEQYQLTYSDYMQVQKDEVIFPYFQSKTVTPTESQQTVTYDTEDGYNGLSSVTVNAISSSYVGSGITRRSSSDLTASGATVTVPSGYYANNASKSVTSMTLPTELTNSASGTNIATLTVDNGSIYRYLQIPAGYNSTNSYYNVQAKTGSATTPATTITANPSISVSSGGLITATASASQSVTPTVSAGYVSSGTAGTVAVSGSNTSQLSTQAATTITPTESAQTAVAAGKYTTGAVTVGAISSTYVGSGITRRDSDDMAFNPQIQSVVAPAGYYADQSTYQIASGTAGTPTATKGTVSNHSVSITPSVTNTTGYITGSTKTGTAVTVSASELVSGSQTITENGTFDVTNLAQVLVNAGLEYETGTYTPTSDIARPTVSFAKTHTTTPFLVMMIDATNTAYSTTYSNISFYFIDVYRAFSAGYPYSSSAVYPALAQYGYRATGLSAASSYIQYNSDNTGDSSTAYSRYWVTESEFHPYSNSTSRYWRSGRSYKWYAIWK